MTLPLAPGADFDFRRVRLEGRFAHDRELQLYGRSHRGVAGVHVLTPLVRPQGAAVLVDRGWVPRTRADPRTRRDGQTPGAVDIVGILRAGGRPSDWTPDNRPEDGIWHYVDIPAMASRVRLSDVRDFIVVAGPDANPGGLPIGKRFVVELTNKHLQYAFTWYALAAVLAAIYLIYHLRPPGAPRRES